MLLQSDRVVRARINCTVHDVLPCTSLSSTVQYSTLHYLIVQCSTSHYLIVQCSTSFYCAVYYNDYINNNKHTNHDNYYIDT